MISRLRGVPVARTAEGVVVDVGGVGYLISATASARARAELGREVTIETHLHVRDDALQLYGFADVAERELFVQLLTVTGIGPKVALAIVSSASADELRRAIALGDHARFQAIQGIGKKTAERIVLELRTKVALVDGEMPAVAGTGGGADTHVVARDALVELGYSVLEAEQALAGVDPALPAEERVLRALRTAA
jgi:Holliday junction DNA helicase RuvA